MSIQSAMGCDRELAIVLVAVAVGRTRATFQQQGGNSTIGTDTVVLVRAGRCAVYSPTTCLSQAEVPKTGTTDIAIV